MHKLYTNTAFEQRLPFLSRRHGVLAGLELAGGRPEAQLKLGLTKTIYYYQQCATTKS